MKTRAINGNADSSLDYEFSTAASSIALGLSLGLLAFTALGAGTKRKIKLKLMIVALAGMVFSITSCDKTGDLDDLSGKEIFVRLAQVD